MPPCLPPIGRPNGGCRTETVRNRWEWLRKLKGIPDRPALFGSKKLELKEIAKPPAGRFKNRWYRPKTQCGKEEVAFKIAVVHTDRDLDLAMRLHLRFNGRARCVLVIFPEAEQLLLLEPVHVDMARQATHAEPVALLSLPRKN